MINTEVREMDATSFADLHDALGLEPAALPGHERRDGERHKFNCEQLIAPFDGITMPNQSAFRHVQCRDLSTQGFSFATFTRPTGELLVAALGTVPFKYFVAQIVRVTSARTPAGLEFSVGCRFLRRLA